MIAFPLELRIRMCWSEEGKKRFIGAMGPCVPLPKYKTIAVDEDTFEYYSRAYPKEMKLALKRVQ
jgi:hypothetical protein